MNLLPNPLLTNVLDMTKVDQPAPINSGGNLQNFPNKNGIDSCPNETSVSTTANNINSIENFLSSRTLTNQLVNNSGLPLGAQIFTIPASLATFPNSDLIPVFINSLGQMVLANTGNILANSLASLATTLTSIQQLSVNRDSNLLVNNQSNTQNTGIMEHMMQQYQQLQLLKTSMIHQSWPNEFQQPSTNQNPPFMAVTIPNSNSNTLKSSEKINGNASFPIPGNFNPSSIPSEKFLTANISLGDRTADNKSPSANSSISSRSVGNKICQMIDVSHDYILSLEDHLVKEKAVELLRHSHSQKNANSSGNAPNSDKSDPATHNMTVDGVDLGEIKEFARNFKIRRLSMGLTQTQVGQALTAAEGPAYSQSAICRFEKLDITPKSAQKIKPILEKWIKESEEKYLSGSNSVDDGSGSDINKKRKRRTSFTPQALEILNIHFERKSHPTGSEMRALANDLNYDREVIRVWFCNKRQALKNSAKRIKQCAPNGECNTQYIAPQVSTNNVPCDPLSANDFRVFKSESQLPILNNNNYPNRNNNIKDINTSNNNNNNNNNANNISHFEEKSEFSFLEKTSSENMEYTDIPCIQNQSSIPESQIADPN